VIGFEAGVVVEIEHENVSPKKCRTTDKKKKLFFLRKKHREAFDGGSMEEAARGVKVKTETWKKCLFTFNFTGKCIYCSIIKFKTKLSLKTSHYYVQDSECN